MKSALQTVKDEYSVNNVDAPLTITVSKLAGMMNTFAIDACVKQKADCSRKVEGQIDRLRVLTAPLPKHLTQ